MALSFLFWSSAFVLIRYLVHHIDATTVVVVRLSLAALIIMPYLWWHRKRYFAIGGDLLVLLLLGVLGITFYNIGLVVGEQTLDAGTASFLVAQTPIFAIFLAYFWTSEKILYKQIAGMFVCFLGTLVIYLYGREAFSVGNIGVLWVLGGTFCQSCFFVLQKRYILRYGASVAFFVVTLGAALPTFFLLPIVWSPTLSASFGVQLALIALALVPSLLGYFFWNKASFCLPTVVIVNALYAIPVLVTVESWIFLNELPNEGELWGGILCLIGFVFMGFGDVLYRRLRRLLGLAGATGK